MPFLVGKSSKVKGSLLKLNDGVNFINFDNSSSIYLSSSLKNAVMEIDINKNVAKIINHANNRIFLNGNEFENMILNENDEIEIDSLFYRFIYDEKSIIKIEDDAILFCDADRFIIIENKEKQSENLKDTKKDENYSITDINRILISANNSKEFVENIFQIIQKKFKNSSFLFFLWNEKSNSFERITPFEDILLKITLSRTLFSTVLSEKKAILSQDILKDSRFKNIESIHGQSINSIMCAPLLNNQKILGLLYVSYADFLYEFTKDDFDFFCRLTLEASLALENLLTKENLLQENNFLKKTILDEKPFIGESECIKKVLNLVKRVAPTDLNVLILGETGTGKELIAKMLHDNSSRSNNPFICLNCSVLSESLLESELFGHVKGAFTGALENKIGRLEQAEGGTLFLDEIGELPVTTQVKLLRFIQEREFEKVGSNKKIKINVRIISATNRDLDKAIKENKFREDFYYRIKGFPIIIPPLRNRIDDIPYLVNFFIKNFCETENRLIPKLSDNSINLLKKYNWPGNVRELKNVIEQSVIMNSSSIITEDDIFLELLDSDSHSDETNNKTLSFRNAVYNFEKKYFTELIQSALGNVSKASKISEIDRTHLHGKLKKYDIDPNKYRR